MLRVRACLLRRLHIYLRTHSDTYRMKYEYTTDSTLECIYANILKVYTEYCIYMYVCVCMCA